MLIALKALHSTLVPNPNTYDKKKCPETEHFKNIIGKYTDYLSRPTIVAKTENELRQISATRDPKKEKNSF